MAITLVGSPVVGSATDGGNVTLTLPAGTAEGDLVVLVGGHPDREDKPVGPSTAGYTPGYANVTAAVNFGVWTKVMGATPDATVTCLGSTWAQHGTTYGAYVLRGADPVTPLDVAVAATVGSVDSPPVTTVTDGAWVIAAAGYDEVSGGSPPSGYGNVIQRQAIDTVRFNLGAATTQAATAGTVDPPAAWALGNTNSLALTVAIRPAGASEPDPAAGVFGGALTRTGVATGARPSAASFTGSHGRTATSTGHRTSAGAFAGTLARAGGFTGTSPDDDTAAGTFAGVLARTGGFTGARPSRATAGGVLARDGHATGARASAAGFGGTLARTGATEGYRAARGLFTGVLARVGGFVGLDPNSRRNITATVTLAPRRSSATLAGRRATATLGPRRATAILEEQ